MKCHNRIICIGNRFINEDAAGLAVYDQLLAMDLPSSVQIIEGGLAGLNLLSHLEQGGRVIFVDTVSGFSADQSIVVLEQKSILQDAEMKGYGHEAGLPYLLSVLPHVNEGKLPDEILLVGVQGKYNGQVVNEAATLSIQLATSGQRSSNA